MMQYTPYAVGIETRLASYYIRGSNGTALVQIEVMESMSAHARHALAREEAIEHGCLPSGTCIVYEVVPQAQVFYNKLITQHEAEAIKQNPELMALVR
jgi:hypothetical protein